MPFNVLGLPRVSPGVADEEDIPLPRMDVPKVGPRRRAPAFDADKARRNRRFALATAIAGTLATIASPADEPLPEIAAAFMGASRGASGAVEQQRASFAEASQQYQDLLDEEYIEGLRQRREAQRFNIEQETDERTRVIERRQELEDAERDQREALERIEARETAQVEGAVEEERRIRELGPSYRDRTGRIRAETGRQREQRLAEEEQEQRTRSVEAIQRQLDAARDDLSQAFRSSDRSSLRREIATLERELIKARREGNLFDQPAEGAPSDTLGVGDTVPARRDTVRRQPDATGQARPDTTGQDAPEISLDQMSEGHIEAARAMLERGEITQEEFDVLLNYYQSR